MHKLASLAQRKDNLKVAYGLVSNEKEVKFLLTDFRNREQIRTENFRWDHPGILAEP